jgi:hypothetical protein
MTHSWMNHICLVRKGDAHVEGYVHMLMQKPAAFLDSQSFDARSSARPAPAPALPAALWFVIGLLVSTLLVYASAKYGIANPDVLG